MTSKPGHNESSRGRAARMCGPATGTFLALVAASLLVAGTGETLAARAPGGHQHAPRTFFGLQPGPTPVDDEDAAKISATRVRTVRIGLDWNRVQPAHGSFVWTRPDREIARLAAHGIQAFPSLAGTPAWVKPRPTTPPLGSKRKVDAWREFWKSGQQRRSPFHVECGCQTRPIPIASWQVWNEPNLNNYFTPRPSPKRYAKLLKHSRPVIEKADRNAKVVLAGLSDGAGQGDIGALTYLKRLYRVHGIKGNFDVAALHPYASNVGDMRGVISRFRRVMRKSHDGRTALWISEIGWGSGHPDHFGLNKGIRGQRRMLQKSMKLLLDRRKAWRMGRVYWFFWRDPLASATNLPCSFCHTSGLLRNNREPKPAYKAFKRLAKRAG